MKIRRCDGEELVNITTRATPLIPHISRPPSTAMVRCNGRLGAKIGFNNYVHEWKSRAAQAPETTTSAKNHHPSLENFIRPIVHNV